MTEAALNGACQAPTAPANYREVLGRCRVSGRPITRRSAAPRGWRRIGSINGSLTGAAAPRRNRCSGSALAIRLAKLGDGSADVAAARRYLGSCLAKLGRPEKARDCSK
ncbi:MAG: tetratricopeptide repeat protein [Gemmatimonadales bacterium]